MYLTKSLSSFSFVELVLLLHQADDSLIQKCGYAFPVQFTFIVYRFILIILLLEISITMLLHSAVCGNKRHMEH